MLSPRTEAGYHLKLNSLTKILDTQAYHQRCSAIGGALEVAIDNTSEKRLQSGKTGRSLSDMQSYPQSKGSAKVLDVVPREWHYGNCTEA